MSREEHADGPPPAEVQDALDRLHAERHEHHTAALAAALEADGVALVVLTGVGTARLLYEGEVRVAADVDVLVRPGTGRRAARTMRSLGYRRQGIAPHATTWAHPAASPVDLHVTLPRSTVGPRVVWSVLGPHREVVSIGDPLVEVPVLDAPALAAHLAVHCTQGAAGPRVDEDLRRAVARFDDATWADAAAVAERLGTGSSLAWALDQVDGGPERRVLLGLPAVERSDLPARSIGEAGIGAFVRSPVSVRERGRSLVGLHRRVRPAR